jgi:hypothetical protein
VKVFKKDDLVQIPPGSWIHKAGWVGADITATGIVTSVAKNGKVSVRVDQVRNRLKRDCETTTADKKVCAFSTDELK